MYNLLVLFLTKHIGCQKIPSDDYIDLISDALKTITQIIFMLIQFYQTKII